MVPGLHVRRRQQQWRPCAPFSAGAPGPAPNCSINAQQQLLLLRLSRIFE